MIYNPYAVLDAVGGGCILTRNGPEIEAFQTIEQAADAAAIDAIEPGPDMAHDFVHETAIDMGMPLRQVIAAEAFKDDLAAAILGDWGVAPGPWARH